MVVIVVMVVAVVVGGVQVTGMKDPETDLGLEPDGWSRLRYQVVVIIIVVTFVLFNVNFKIWLY